MTVEGTTTDQFVAVKRLLSSKLDNGEELGASIAVDVDGDRVVDLWGGYRDPERRIAWTRDTLINVFSTTKLVTALAVLLLVDRGEIDLDAPVATYWPEFAANGKQNIPVRSIMGHTSGVSGWEQPIGITDLYDLPTSTARLAAQAPWWEPGTAGGYHAATYGHLLGELIRRVDGRSLTDFVTEELGEPLEADVQIGAREKDWSRIATLIPSPPVDGIDMSSIDQESVSYRTMMGPVPPSTETVASPEWRRAEIGAINGHASAEGLVRLLRMVTLGGEIDGRRFLSQGTIDRIFEPQAEGVDLVNQVPMRWGIGFGLTPVAFAPFLPAGRVAWWGGMGGSIGIVDLDRRTTFAYTPNNMNGGGFVGFDRAGEYISSVYHAM